MRQQTYLIQIGDTDLFKIGKSKDPELRLAQLAESQPYEYKLVAICSKNIETKLHKLFSKYSWHLGNSREWFKLDCEALRRLLLFYAEPSLLKNHGFKPKPTKTLVSQLVCSILGVASLQEPFDIIISIKDIYSHESFNQLAELYNKDVTSIIRHSWFWRDIIRNMFNLHTKRYGNTRQGLKYRIINKPAAKQ